MNNQLKALEILKDIQDSKWCGVKPTLVKWKLEDFNEAIAELESLESQDKLAELEKVILDYYLEKGYQLNVGGWSFKVNISTLHKTKDIQIMFRQDICSNWETIFRIDAKNTKQMFDKAIEHFKIVDKEDL